MADELAVPDAAMQAAVGLLIDAGSVNYIELVARCRVIAAPVVAAELRRAAEEWERMAYGRPVPRWLRDRADELDAAS